MAVDQINPPLYFGAGPAGPASRTGARGHVGQHQWNFQKNSCPWLIYLISSAKRCLKMAPERLLSGLYQVILLML